MKRILIRIGLFLLIVLFLSFLAFKFSPWPSTVLIRYAFNKGAEKANDGLAKHVPDGISEFLNQQYDINDQDAFLDVYYPSTVSNTNQQLPVIVWIHGGGWVSGHKEDIANYCRLLSGKDYVAVSLDYSIAPEEHYPTPLQQVNKALAYLQQNAKHFHLNPSHFILAGDSGGAHIAAQIGNVICNDEYAELLDIVPSISSSQLSGLLLYCGPYDAENLNLEGGYGSFLSSILWAYLGEKDFTNLPIFKTFSVINFVDSRFPPAFISVGNGDPLQIQSKALARRLASSGVKVDTLFYPSDYVPSLPHEYQFNMDIDAGKLSLQRSINFIQSVTH